jgi:hypothetical protein
MIYRSEDIYKKIKEGPEILNEEEFLQFYKPEHGSSSITDEMLLIAFSDLRLALGQNFKLDQICFLFGNGCSLYAGSKSTENFNMTDAADEESLESISDVVKKISGWTMEEQLNAMLTVQEFYRLIDDEKKETVEKIIDAIKAHLLKTYVNSVKYRELHLHEVMLLKLRSFGCLNKVNFYTPNYDLAMEYVLDKLGIEYANGFSGFINRKFDPKSLLAAKTTRLLKIHGSVNWVFDEADKIIKEVQPKFPEDGSVEIPESKHVLIYPTSQKLYQTYNAPYSELMRSMLDGFESRRNMILVLGYRYADEHINEILFKAVANPNNIFYFFDYGDGSGDFIKRMIELSGSTQNINILLGKFLGDFETFVKYMLPANAEKTDEERIFELLNKVMEKRTEEGHAE